MKRKPVLPPEVIAAASDTGGVDKWQQLSVELSAGDAGLRHILVVLDGEGRAISASDWVLTIAGTEYLHENVGGRLEADGRFLGTRWRSLSRLLPGEDEPQHVESLPSPPSEEDAAALKQLVACVLEKVR